MGKERKFDGAWDERRVLYNVLLYADEKGYVPYNEKKDDWRKLGKSHIGI